MLLHVERLWKPLLSTMSSCQQKRHTIPSMKPREQLAMPSGYTPKELRIYELVSEGITDTQKVKRALKHYTLHVLCPEQKPELVDRAYTDIRNHVYKAQRACQLSKLDQENLWLKIEQQKKQREKQTPQSNFHFCPYKSTLDSDKRVTRWGEQLHTDTTLSPPRTVATTALKKIWQHHLIYRCYIQNHQVWVSPVLSCSEDN